MPTKSGAKGTRSTKSAKGIRSNVATTGAHNKVTIKNAAKERGKLLRMLLGSDSPLIGVLKDKDAKHFAHIKKAFGDSIDGQDPFDPVNDLESDSQLHRLALDLLLGPIAVSPRNLIGARYWRNYEVAFGPDWQNKRKIAHYLFDLKFEGTAEYLIPRNGIIALGPGGSTFHVCLQFAWRLRQSIETNVQVFDNSTRIQLHTHSFEAARLLGPLAVNSMVQVYLAGTNVSRSASTERENVSILLTEEKFPDERIDCLIIGCQSIQEDGRVFTWANNRVHRSVVQGYIDRLKADGRLILVCAGAKTVRPAGAIGTELLIKHPSKKSYLITDANPRKTFPSFSNVLWPGQELR